MRSSDRACCSTFTRGPEVWLLLVEVAGPYDTPMTGLEVVGGWWAGESRRESGRAPKGGVMENVPEGKPPLFCACFVLGRVVAEDRRQVQRSSLKKGLVQDERSSRCLAHPLPASVSPEGLQPADRSRLSLPPLYRPVKREPDHPPLNGSHPSQPSL